MLTDTTKKKILLKFPDRFGYGKLKFTAEEVAEIQKDLVSGVKTRIIYQKWKLSSAAVKYFIDNHMHSGELHLALYNFKDDTLGTKPLGHKSVPYFLTEKEIEQDLELPSTFTWDSLSELEKTFYATYD